jgi:hypothetical protein
VVRGNLQIFSHKDTRATILAARIFQLLMAIVAIFDFETEQLDAINAFINSLINELVYIKFLPGFGKKGKAL